MRRKDRRLVPVAEFAAAEQADEAWSLLDEHGIAASVVGDPAAFGSAPVYRIYVAAIDAEAAQRTIAPIING